MRTINQYIKRTTDEPIAREDTEWANFWYDYARDSSKKRILMIGDSTVRMIRSTFSEIYGIAVDMIGSSANLHDIFFKAQIDAFFASKCYLYDAIFIQLGHHFKKNDCGGGVEEEDYAAFKEDYLNLIDYLQQFTDNIILLSIFDSVIVARHKKIKNKYLLTWIKRMDKIWMLLKEPQYDAAVNEITNKRNSIIERIACEKDLVFCDINQIMKTTHYKQIDHIHFQKSARKFICKKYADCIENLLKEEKTSEYKVLSGKV